MCLNLYSFINKQSLSNKILLFIFFTNFGISELFSLEGQNGKCANMQNGNKRNTKTKGRMTMKIGIDV